MTSVARKNSIVRTLLVASMVFAQLWRAADAGCPVTDNPSQMFQCLTINPQAFIDLISKSDYKSFCHMANGYMTCMTTYLRDCLGGKAATGILEELQDLNLKCCISGRTQDCVIKNPALLQKCFAADNTVLLANGQSKRIGDAQVGDLVKAVDSSGMLIDTEIVTIMHKNLNSSTMFQVFYDSNDNHISLTSQHMLFVNNKGYIKAAEVSVGDQLRYWSLESNQLVNFVVKSIDYTIQTGFTAPLTDSGTILVNQIDSSCYAETNSHRLADLAMLPLKMWHRVSKYVNNLERTNADRVDVGRYESLLYYLVSQLAPSVFGTSL